MQRGWEFRTSCRILMSSSILLLGSAPPVNLSVEISE
ncbi:hypothetical protein M758_1G237700 [Ceratodon purpureus]|nr:hypothetical protein M758_1G237700 [Ceratodon purpureus]